MADVSPKNAVNLSGDLKIRSAFDMQDGAGFGGAQFLDVMMARLTALGSSDTDLKAILKKAADAPKADAPRETAFLKHTRGLRRKDSPKESPEASAASAPAPAPASPDEKIRAKIAEILSRDDVPVKDDRPVEALKQVAAFLLRAEEQGKIDLPDELAEALQIFLAQPEEMNAAEIVEFMSEFISLFREMNVVLKPISATLPAETGDKGDALIWPKELADLFAELKLSGFAKEGQTIDVLRAVKALKALVNASHHAGAETLRERAAAVLVPQNEAEILIPKALTEKIAADGIVKPAADPVHTITPVEIVKAEANPNVPVQKAEAVVQPAATPVVVSVAAEAIVKSDAKPKGEQPLLDLSGPQPDSTDGEGEDSLLSLSREKPAPQIGNAKEGRAPREMPTPQNAAPNNTANALAASAARAQAHIAAPALAASPVFAAADAGLVAMPDGDGLTALSPNALNAAKFSRALNAASLPQHSAQSSATQQVLVHIRNLAAGKSSQINIQLSPAELGKVELRLNIQRNGTTQVVVTVDKPETLVLLQKDSAQLEKALNQAGLNTSQENLSFNLREQRDPKGGFSGRKRLGGDPEDAKVQDLALNVHSDGQIISDTRVNYHA